MKINKNYFSYLFKSKKIGWIFFFIMYMAIALASFMDSSSDMIDLFSNVVIVAGIESIIMAFLLPVFFFSFVHRKRSCDLYFALPIKRSEMLCTIIAFAFLLCFGFFVFTIGIAYCFTLFNAKISLINLFVTSAFLAISILALLLINTAIYLFSNNIIDGLIILCAYTFIPWVYTLLCSVINTIVFLDNANFAVLNGVWLSPISIVISNFQALHAKIQQSNYVINSMIPSYNNLYTILLIVYSFIACVTLYYHFIKRKTERAETVSNAFLSYPLLINLCTFLVLSALAFSMLKGYFSNYVLFFIFVFFCYILALFVYKRKIQITFKNVCSFAIMLAFTIGLAQFTFMNKGFNIAKQYSLKEGTSISYSVSGYQLTKDLAQQAHEGDSIEYRFVFTIPTDAIDSTKYKEVISILENYRNACIDYWYTSESIGNYDTFALNVMQKKQTHTIKDYIYRSNKGLSINDLEIINTFTPVTVDVYDEYTFELKHSYNLSEYIEEVLEDGTTTQQKQ